MSVWEIFAAVYTLAVLYELSYFLTLLLNKDPMLTRYLREDGIVFFTCVTVGLAVISPLQLSLSYLGRLATIVVRRGVRSCPDSAYHTVGGADMNYYQPRKRKDGKWDFTCRNDDDVWAVGYCAEAGGGHHESEEEARDCYTKYLLDKELTFTKMANQQRRCQVCQEYTEGIAQVGQATMYVLCDEHRNREEVEKLYGKVGNITSSY